MSKKKFDLDSTLVDVDQGDDYGKADPIPTVTLTFRVTKEFRRDFKKICFDRGISLVDALREALEILKNT